MSFTAGTLIETLFGPVPVEALRPGDWVLTQEAGPQPLRGRAARRFAAADLAARRGSVPILIRAGALRRGVPARDTLVTPRQEVRTVDGGAAPAADLIDGRRVLAARPRRAVTFVALALDAPWTLTANGAPMTAQALPQEALPSRAVPGLAAPRVSPRLPFEAARR